MEQIVRETPDHVWDEKQWEVQENLSRNCRSRPRRNDRQTAFERIIAQNRRLNNGSV